MNSAIDLLRGRIMAVQPEREKMDRVVVELADFIMEQHELEWILLKHFQKWKAHACQCLDEEEIRGVDWIDVFSKDVRKGLLKLKQQGKLRDC